MWKEVVEKEVQRLEEEDCTITGKMTSTVKRRVKSHLPFAGIIKSSPYSPR
jgi:hypothetical protein